MSMMINFFAVPDILTDKVMSGKLSILDLAQYTQEAYNSDKKNNEDIDKEFPPLYSRESLELYYFQTFNILDELYGFVFADDAMPLADGRQPYTNEEANTLLNEYVTYSGGFLMLGDIKCIHNQLVNLSFKDLIKMAFGKNDSTKKEAIDFIVGNTQYSEQDIMEELPLVENDYNEFVEFIDKLVKLEDKQKLGLFIAIN